VVLEHLVDVDNVGSCFRNARAFGAAAVLLDDRCADPLYRKAVRTSMGTVLELPWTVAPIGEIVEALHTRGVSTIGLTPSGDAPDLATVFRAMHVDASLALVVGNEGHGLTVETLARCSHRACIPMAAGADSLNVATALAVGLAACW
jgi:tRNA G18 (ribose-2'-O)-methylase SpoU